jgi:hypothetical protein
MDLKQTTGDLNMSVYILKDCVIGGDVVAFLDKQDVLDYCNKRNIQFKDDTETTLVGSHKHTVCAERYKLTVLPLIEEE